jgi:hypothetical protein
LSRQLVFQSNFYYTIVQFNFLYLYFRKFVKPFTQNPFKIRLTVKQFFDMCDFLVRRLGHGNKYTCTEQHIATQKNIDIHVKSCLFPKWDSNIRFQCFSLPRLYALSMRPKAMFRTFALLCTTLFCFSVRKQAILIKVFVGFLIPCGEIPNVIFSLRTLHCSP